MNGNGLSLIRSFILRAAPLQEIFEAFNLMHELVYSANFHYVAEIIHLTSE